jgi:hypothetical protein
MAELNCFPIVRRNRNIPSLFAKRSTERHYMKKKQQLLKQTILLYIVFAIRLCAIHFPVIKYKFTLVFYLNSIDQCTFPIKEGFLFLQVLQAGFNITGFWSYVQNSHSSVLLSFSDLYFGRGAEISTDALLISTID